MNVAFTSSLLIAVSLFGMYTCQDYYQMARNRRCNARLSRCGRGFQRILSEMESEPDVDRACELAGQARRCIGSCLSVVIDNAPAERAVIKVLEYVCDPSRREEVEDIAQAECFTDGTIEREFEGEAQQCVQSMTSEVERLVETAVSAGNMDMATMMCPVLGSVMTCIDGKVEKLCGEDVVPFVNDIFDIVLREMLIGEMPSCFDQVNSVTAGHNVVKRAVGYLKMLRKK